MNKDDEANESVNETSKQTNNNNSITSNDVSSCVKSNSNLKCQDSNHSKTCQEEKTLSTCEGIALTKGLCHMDLPEKSATGDRASLALRLDDEAECPPAGEPAKAHAETNGTTEKSHQDQQESSTGQDASQNLKHQANSQSHHQRQRHKPRHEHKSVGSNGSSTTNRNSSNHQNNNNSNITDQQHKQQQQVPISADYLAQLIKDKKQLALFPSVFIHVQRLIDDEINKVRQSLFQLNDVVNQPEPMELPEAEGEFVQLQEKIYVPIGEHPEYNFVGRLLGPRGMTAKQLEQETGCKIMIRGRGSMRDKKKEEQNRGKPNWEHLNDDLHVLITVEDAQNRANVKLERALNEVKQLLVPIVDGEDELKKRQLMELAIINGTYRDCNYNEALSKMLNDVTYQEASAGCQDVGVAGLGGSAPSQQQLAAAAAAAVAIANGSQQHQGSQMSQRQYGQHYTMGQHHHNSHQMPAINGSSISSGITSTGSTTPNSVHGPPAHLSHQHPSVSSQRHHNQLNTAAVVAAAAAAAAASQHQQPPVHMTGAMQAQAAHSLPLHNHLVALGMAPRHSHPHHGHQSPAAVAAATALMANHHQASAAEAGAMMFHAQQYHDFHQHYAAMAAAAAASQQPMMPNPNYHVPQPGQHPHHHHQATAAAVAQAVAAATAAAAANHQIHHYHQQQHQHQRQQDLATVQAGEPNQSYQHSAGEESQQLENASGGPGNSQESNCEPSTPSQGSSSAAKRPPGQTEGQSTNKKSRLD